MNMEGTGPRLIMTAHEPCWVRLHGANQTLLATIRASVRPRNRRRYDRDEQVWEFHWHWLHQVVEWARPHYDHVDWADLPTQWQLRAAGAEVGDSGSLFVAEKSVEDSPYATLFITEEAPMEVVIASYKALARMHHPDVGGDAQDFLRISHAYGQIRKARDLLSPQAVDNPED